MAKKRTLTFSDWLQTVIIRVCRVHFIFAGVYAVYIIASDATHLITPEIVYKRWLAIALLFSVVSLIWYSSRARFKPANFYRFLIYALIVSDIAFATFNVYTQRGMSARAVFLYAIPIIISAVLLSRVAIYMTACIATAAYMLAAVKYFADFFNEGYKAELYIETSFYIAGFFVLAALLSIIIRFKNPESELGI
jgi:hypothetical protein